MINFFNEDIKFTLKGKKDYKIWLRKVAEKEGFTINSLNYIFCSDVYLHEINLEYLNHDTYTDIITFDNSEDRKIIEGDIFISIDRVRENSKILFTLFDEELKRVIVHGLLHLCGYSDSTFEQKQEIRNCESNYINEFLINTPRGTF